MTLSADLWMLLALVLLGAAFLVLHVWILWQGLRASQLQWRWRLVALLPPATPVVAWLGGRRVAPCLWGVALASYVVLRLLA